MEKFKIGIHKHIALIAHDNRKEALITWIKDNKEELSKHFLYGTGTTAKLISEQVGLPVKPYLSGPLGGDQQIGSHIADGQIDFMIFFWDPLTSQPHDPDVKALLRIAVLYDIPVAMSKSTADFLMASRLMENDYERDVLNYYNDIRTYH